MTNREQLKLKTNLPATLRVRFANWRHSEHGVRLQLVVSLDKADGYNLTMDADHILWLDESWGGRLIRMGILKETPKTCKVENRRELTPSWVGPIQVLKEEDEADSRKKHIRFRPLGDDGQPVNLEVSTSPASAPAPTTTAEPVAAGPPAGETQADRKRRLWQDWRANLEAHQAAVVMAASLLGLKAPEGALATLTASIVETARHQGSLDLTGVNMTAAMMDHVKAAGGPLTPVAALNAHQGSQSGSAAPGAGSGSQNRKSEPLSTGYDDPEPGSENDSPL